MLATRYAIVIAYKDVHGYIHYKEAVVYDSYPNESEIERFLKLYNDHYHYVLYAKVEKRYMLC